MYPAGCWVVLVTVGSSVEAERIARALVEERLAACVNVLSAVRSIYRWEGRVADDAEVLLLIKTMPARFEALARRVREMHSYEVPEILAVPAAAGSASYLGWVADATRPESPP